MKRLAIFDIDGTLARTSDVDAACFEQALYEEFAIGSVDTSWESFEHVTDSFILSQLVQRKFGREVTAGEVERFQRRFVALLKRAHQNAPESFAEVPGALRALAALRESRDWAVAIATGGFRPSAIFKLGCLGIDGERLPGAFADDALTREEILALALRRATAGYAVGRFEAVAYFGDRIWDARTAARLGIPFIGVATKLAEERLRLEGAVDVLTDFADYSRVCEALDAAAYVSKQEQQQLTGR